MLRICYNQQDISTGEIIVERHMQMYKNYSFIIREIYWERIFLHFLIETECRVVTTFILENTVTGESVLLDIDKREQNQYFFCLNIAAANVRSFLENGKWTIKAFLADEKKYVYCYVSTELAYRMENLTKVFRYGKDRYAYTIDFTVYSEDQKNLQLCMKSYFMQQNDCWRKRSYIQKNNAPGWVQFILNMISDVGVYSMNVWYRLCAIFRNKKKKHLLLMNETNDLNADNLYAIERRLRERGLDKKIYITRSFRQTTGKSGELFSWLKLIARIARQDIIILDNFAPIFGLIKLRKDVELVQVWHAGGGFKAVGYCRFGKEGSPYPTFSCHKAYTTAMTGSRQLIKVFEEVFGIEKEAFLPVGMPRLDGYLEKEKKEKFCEKFYESNPFLKNKKIILFAPTYRGTGQKDAYYDFDKIDLKQIYTVCGNDWVFIIKMHPFIKDSFEISEELQDRIFDFSNFSSINELFYVTDLLITDYSSNFYEFSLMKKPMLFYTYDRELYELTRGVYRSIKDAAPGKVCDSFEELIQAIQERDFEYEKVEKFVKENFDESIGNACDQFIDYVILKKGKNI